MHELWSSASYEPHLLSLPFAYAPAAMLMVIAYAIVMRGAPVLRGWFLLHGIALLPYAIALTLSPSVVAPAAATGLFRFGASFIPLAASCGCGFQLALLGQVRRYRYLLGVLLATGIGWAIIGVTTDLVISGVHWLPAGMWFATAGPWAILTLVTTVASATLGFVSLTLAAVRMPPSLERRQIRQALIANFVTYLGLLDVALGWGHGVFPLGWVLTGTGSLLVVRALVVEDLLRVRAVDTSAPQLVLHLAASLLLGWWVLTLLGPRVPWWMQVATLCICFASVRVIIAVIGLVNRGARGGEGPLDRLLAQLVGRSRTARSELEVAQLATDIIELGLGVRPEILLASEEDWGWTTAAGGRIADADAPDPLLGSWMIEQRGAIFADETELRVPADLRPLLAPLFERHAARAVVAIANHDELLALICVPAAGPRLRGRALWFLERGSERLGEALLHARLAKRAAASVELAREVELAATVQADLLPPQALQQLGAVSLYGSWQPASQCAGDLWGAYPLGDGRVLVAVGDVTGHGVASAMVTAAACGALDVAVRHERERLELGALMASLDAVVRRIGGGELGMTCTAAILDPAGRTIDFVSCGHAVPYLCRARPIEQSQADDSVMGSVIELQALVARGNPLGTGELGRPRIVRRALQPGDVLVWYTDGVIEANDPAGEPFGDRRLQRLLRRVDRAHLAPQAVHDLIAASVATHRAGRPLADDETLVVAQVAS